MVHAYSRLGDFLIPLVPKRQLTSFRSNNSNKHYDVDDARYFCARPKTTFLHKNRHFQYLLLIFPLRLSPHLHHVRLDPAYHVCRTLNLRRLVL